MTQWLNVGVKGCAAWPKEETVVNFAGHSLTLKPATKETEQSVHIELKRISDKEGLTIINRFLSTLSWCDDQGMENIYGWSGSSSPVAVPRENRAVGSSIAFPWNRDIEKSKKAQLALALYREALTINSVPFSFLSYFKILNMFWKTRKEITDGIKNVLPKINDKEALERLHELNNKNIDAPDYLYESGRCAIAHAYSDPIVDPDDQSDLWRLSQDKWLVKAIASLLIEKNFNVSKSIMG